LAKDLVKAGRAGSLREDDPMEEFARRKFSERCSLTMAQFVIARSYGFESWPKFSKHLRGLEKASGVSRFEEAADAIVEGDIGKLKGLLREYPGLVRARSTREHGATLLHYVSANGVEGYRQKTPKNIVEIAEVLLDAGAEMDAAANVYGGGCTALGLTATSVHPEKAGVQRELLGVLLERGADAEAESAGNRHSLVVACLANGRLDAAEFLAPRVKRLELAGAAGVGRIELVKELFEGASTEQKNAALAYAAEYGRVEVVEFLLKKGLDVSTPFRDQQTPMHWAVIGGHLGMVQLLLGHRPDLEATNVYGGTVFGQALWSAGHGGDAETYIAILEALAEAGARIPERHVPVNARVDEWLARRGSVAEPSWYWFGEKPRV
jgi:ankyrin repeat protein